MEELIKIFHIDWKLLIAQILNFCIVLSVLWFFAMKPIMKLLKTREKKISEGLENADKVEQKMAEAEQEKKKKVVEGRREAQIIIENATAEAEKVKEAKEEETRLGVQKIVAEARREINSEREKMVKAVKTELGDLVLLALGKISKEGIGKKAHEKLIDEALEEINKKKIK
ncbi:F0F1 ATP synthase subunit B [Patescibacteria group bacterium]|nr:F0F1 ATP synthase subunit B [Patescibacteria group bacterium]